MSTVINIAEREQRNEQNFEKNKEIDYLDSVFEEQRAAFRRNPMPGAEARIRNLERLKNALLDHRDTIADAINRDFGARARDESFLAEIFPSIEGIRYAVKRIKKWMKPSRRGVGLIFQPARARVLYQPLGVVGIIVPWNYPVYLAVGPLIGALAAGNRAMIKMSEFTPHTSELMKKILYEAFDEDLVAVVTGDAEVAAAFSRKPWDHLLFTGSTQVGHHVMHAAADNLTPVTLELGGKSPAIIGPDVPIADAAERIAFGKVFNVGQTCVAPDYVLCPKSGMDAFISAFRDAVARMYSDMRANPDYTAIINERQFDRLQGLLQDAREKGARVIPVNPAGEDFQGTRKMPVYLLLDVNDDMRVLQEEIFGPILPVLPYDDLRGAVRYVNDHPRPLALYYFGYDSANTDDVLANTVSGGAVVNDTLAHVAQDDMPFGGVGPSGMGAYHAHEGFLTFSKAKGVLYKPRFNSTKLIYPPYNRWIHRLIYKIFLR